MHLVRRLDAQRIEFTIQWHSSNNDIDSIDAAGGHWYFFTFGRYKVYTCRPQKKKIPNWKNRLFITYTV